MWNLVSPLKKAGGLLGLRSLYRRIRPLRPLTIPYGPLTGAKILGHAAPDYEPHVSATIERLVQPSWVCVDVGAHVGIFTLLLAKLVGPAGKVIAFEAHPSNAAVLKKNVALNGYSKLVRIENLAISDGSRASVELYPSHTGGSTEWHIMGHDVQGQVTNPEMRVPACSLDNYFRVGARLDFVKMDIEGAEAQALAGMRRILREIRPILLIEFHNEEGWAGRGELYAAGYKLHDCVDQRELDATRDAKRVYHVVAYPTPLGTV